MEIYCPVFNLHNMDMDFNQLYVVDSEYTEKDAIKSLKNAIIEKLIHFTYGPEPSENDDISRFDAIKHANTAEELELALYHKNCIHYIPKISCQPKQKCIGDVRVNFVLNKHIITK